MPATPVHQVEWPANEEVRLGTKSVPRYLTELPLGDIVVLLFEGYMIVPGAKQGLDTWIGFDPYINGKTNPAWYKEYTKAYYHRIKMAVIVARPVNGMAKIEINPQRATSTGGANAIEIQQGFSIRIVEPKQLTQEDKTSLTEEQVAELSI